MQHPIPPLIRPIILGYPPKDTNPHKYNVRKIPLKYCPKMSKFEGSIGDSLRPFQYFLRDTKTMKIQKLSLKSKYSCSGGVDAHLPGTETWKAFKSLSNLSSLRLKFFVMDKEQMTSCTKTLVRSFVCPKNLENLEITFSQSDVEDVQMLQNLLKLIKRMKRGSRLSLHFHASAYFQGHFYNITSITLIKRTHNLSLPKISVLFQDHDPKLNLEFLKLFETFQKIKSLPTAILDFSTFKTLNPDNEILTDSLACLNPLLMQKLDLKFFRPFHDYEDLIKFSNTLKKFTGLTSLHLKLSNCRLNKNPNEFELCTASSCLLSLRSLKLQFMNGYGANFIVPNIGPAFRFLQNLTSLDLHCSSYIMTIDNNIQQLFSNLGFLHSLRSLAVRIVWTRCDDFLSVGALEILGQSLTELVHLQNLCLTFGLGKFVTESGIEAITNAAQHLKNLFSFELKIKDD